MMTPLVMLGFAGCLIATGIVLTKYKPAELVLLTPEERFAIDFSQDSFL